MVSTLLTGIRSLLFPAACVGCEQPLENPQGCPVCAGCMEQLPGAPPAWGEWQTHAFDEVRYAFLYKGLAQELILRLKYQGQRYLADFLGRECARRLRAHVDLEAIDAVVPVPLHPTRLRERTFNQAQLLAEAWAREWHLPVWSDLLTRCRLTRAQAELTREQRLQNVAGAFVAEADPAVRGAHLLLVDDVFTTGATVQACSVALRAVGVERITIATVAHG